jgi:hypothetical protein
MSLDRVGNGYGMRENEGNRVFSLYFYFFNLKTLTVEKKCLVLKRRSNFTKSEKKVFFILDLKTCPLTQLSHFYNPIILLFHLAQY